MKKLTLIALVCSGFFISCNSDDNTNDDSTNEDITNDDSTNEDGNGLEVDPNAETFILVELNGGEAYIINKDGEEVYNFDLEDKLGNDANLLDDGSLVASVKAENPNITTGGFGGKFIKQNPDKTIEWEFKYSFENEISHHDVEYLSNGNLLFIAWQKISLADAQNEGFEGDEVDILVDALVEINPITQEVVWKWSMMDHLIQDFDDTKENYGVISENAGKIDINYNSNRGDGDISHSNGIVLDEANDLIYMTANYYNEVWVIDHSTTREQAATNTGGNYDKGGDLVYRFGNPDAYDNSQRQTFFNRVHAPNLLDSGNLLLFSNQEANQQSEAVEMKLPGTLSLEEGSYEDPEIVWSFTHEDLFSNIMSNAERLRNGNTLITEGRFGTLWEVTEEGDVVWQYETDPPEQWIWRSYPLYSDDSAFEALGLEPSEN